MSHTHYLMIWPVGRTLAKLVLRRTAGCYYPRARVLLLPPTAGLAALTAAVTPDAADLALALSRSIDPQQRVATSKLRCARVAIHTTSVHPIPRARAATVAAQPGLTRPPTEPPRPRPLMALLHPVLALIRPVRYVLSSLVRVGQ